MMRAKPRGKSRPRLRQRYGCVGRSCPHCGKRQSRRPSEISLFLCRKSPIPERERLAFEATFRATRHARGARVGARSLRGRNVRGETDAIAIECVDRRAYIVDLCKLDDRRTRWRGRRCSPDGFCRAGSQALEVIAMRPYRSLDCHTEGSRCWCKTANTSTTAASNKK